MNSIKSIKQMPKTKLLCYLVIGIVIISIIITSIYAAYLKKAETVTNTFSPAVTIIPEVQENFDGKIKKDVKIEVGKTGYPVYVRTKLEFNWQKKDSSDNVVYYIQPTENDYSLIINESKWTLKSDGYYYYSDPVPSNGVTDALILECTQTKAAPDENYTLSVKILTQTVQAVGHTDDGAKTSVEDAWDAVEPTTESTSE